MSLESIWRASQRALRRAKIRRIISFCKIMVYLLTPLKKILTRFKSNRYKKTADKGGLLVGVVRLERTTTCTPCKYASQLRYTPMVFFYFDDAKVRQIFESTKSFCNFFSNFLYLGMFQRLTRLDNPLPQPLPPDGNADRHSRRRQKRPECWSQSWNF